MYIGYVQDLSEALDKAKCNLQKHADESNLGCQTMRALIRSTARELNILL